MKQIKAIALSLAVCAVLTSCGSKESVSSAVAESQAASSAVSSEPVSSEQAVGESTASTNMKFDFTYEKFLEDLNVKLVDSGNTQINVKPVETKEMPDKASNNVVCNVYSFVDGVYLYLYYDKADNGLVAAALAGMRDGITETSVKQFKSCVGIIEKGMARDEAGTVEKKLNTNNVKEIASNSIESGKTAFSYDVSEQGFLFYISTSQFISSRQESATSSAPKKEFNLELNHFIDKLNTGFAAKKYQSLPEPSKTTDDFPGFGEANCYEYVMGDGVKLVVYADPGNNKIVNIHYYVDTSKATNQDLTYYGYCVGIMLGFIDGDEGQTVHDNLNLSNITKDSVTSAHSSLYSYSYIVDKGTLMLSIGPNK